MSAPESSCPCLNTLHTCRLAQNNPIFFFSPHTPKLEYALGLLQQPPSSISYVEPLPTSLTITRRRAENKVIFPFQYTQKTDNSLGLLQYRPTSISYVDPLPANLKISP